MKRISDERIKRLGWGWMLNYDYELNDILQAQLESCEKEVREIFEEIEKKSTKVTGSLVKPYKFINEDEWQALKERLGVK